jgi:hypothetical protein
MKINHKVKKNACVGIRNMCITIVLTRLRKFALTCMIMIWRNPVRGDIRILLEVRNIPLLSSLPIAKPSRNLRFYI